jgi:H+-translocating NAD(P) transhydrogenase subunit alpha
MGHRDTQDSEPSGRVTIGVLTESVAGETRVAMIPDTVRSLAPKGVDVVVQAGAGEGSSIHDDEYTAVGATVVPDAASVIERADIIAHVQAPSQEEVRQLRKGQTLISLLAPLSNHDLVRTLADQGVTSLAMDAVPRITRAQSMDALSAMSTIGGYKAVLLAANELPKFFPLLMTAAGTIAPAKVLVLGAGVAGLQAIATARRLGAVVEAYDVRPVVKEQVESLGAKFIEIDVGGEDMQTAGGYARPLTPEEQKIQQEALNDHIARFDVVITTALVPGRPAPKMVPAVAVQKMRTGSVIVDLAAETGGNCELTVPGEVVEREGVTIIGLLNLPATLPVHASQMYARVVQNFLGLLIQDGAINLNLDDEIIRGMCITRDGEIIQEQTRKVMGLGEAAAPAPAPEPEPEPAGAGVAEEATDPVEDAVEVDIVAEAFAGTGADEAGQLESGETDVAGALEETAESVEHEPIAMPSTSEADESPIEMPAGGSSDSASGGSLTDVEPLPTEEGAHDPRLDETTTRVEDEYVPGEEEVRLEEVSEPSDDDATDRDGRGGSLA